LYRQLILSAIAISIAFGCNSELDAVSVSATAQATSFQVARTEVNAYVIAADPIVERTLNTDGKVIQALQYLQLVTGQADPNNPDRTLGEMVGPVAPKVVFLDDLSVEQILANLSTPSDIYIPEALQSALQGAISVLDSALSKLDTSIEQLQQLEISTETALLHRLQLDHFIALSDSYKQIRFNKAQYLTTGSITDVEQMRGVLLLQSEGRALKSVREEFKRLDRYYGS